MAKLVAKTYSEALFEVALEENKVDLFSEEFNFVMETFKMHPEFFSLFKSPLISVNEKKQIVAEVFGNKISAEMSNFLKIVLDKRRGYYIDDINHEFQKMINAHKGIVEAVVVTAVPLSEEEKASLQEKLSQITGKSIMLKNEVDKDLIGGALVRVGDKVIDGTIKGRLEEVKESLSQIIV